MFVIYRYMFEKGRKQEWEYFYFEYGNLDLVINSLDLVSGQFLSEREQFKASAT